MSIHFEVPILFTREGGSTFFSRKKFEDFQAIYVYLHFKELNERLVIIIIRNTYKKYLKTHNVLFCHIYTFYKNPRI